MDANLWKQIVDKAISRTRSRNLLWSKSDRGPDKALSFEASIDEHTTLNIWGYEKNYSYELCLTKQTMGDPFEERKRVTTKGSAEGIDFRGLFKAAQSQSSTIVRERAFNAVLDFLSNPTVIDPNTEEVISPENELERSGDLSAMGRGWFTHSEDEEILALVRDLTAAGSIPWTFSKTEDSDEQTFSALVGDSNDEGDYCLFLALRVGPTSSKTSGKVVYNFELQHGSLFWVDVELRPTDKLARQSWLLASEIHTIVSKQVRHDEEEFNKIVRDNIVHEILASLDDPRK